MAIQAKQIETKDALDAIELYFNKGWTDGLPVVPPTEDKIKAMLESVNMTPKTVVGAIPERGRVFTAEVVAINAVMAGCLPGYFPVVMAAVQAITDPAFGLHGPSASTHGPSIMLVVNGPIACEIGLNDASNAFGPGNRANATIGRAIRLLLINAGGSPEFDRSTLGSPAKYSFCFAEKETDWLPLHQERGFARDDSVVTVFATEGPNQVHNHTALNPENILRTIADRMSSLGTFNIGCETEMAVAICPEHYRDLAGAGWTKEKVREFLYDNAKRTVADLKRGGVIEAEVAPGDEKQFIHAVPSPNHLLLVVAGGEAGRFSACMPGWFSAKQSHSVSKSISVATGFS